MSLKIHNLDNMFISFKSACILRGNTSIAIMSVVFEMEIISTSFSARLFWLRFFSAPEILYFEILKQEKWNLKKRPLLVNQEYCLIILLN